MRKVKVTEWEGLADRQPTHAQELDPALEKALAHDGPSMVEVIADPERV